MSFKTDQLFRDGLASLQTGRVAEAESAFRKVLRRERAHLGALNLLGIVLTQLGQFAEAETHLAAALKQNSNSDVTLYNYGIVLKELQRPAEALKRFDEALAINAGIADTWNNRGVVLNQLDQYEDAIASYDKAIALKPNYAEALNNKARSLALLNRDEESLAACEQALTYDPQMPEAWFGRGNMLFKLSRYDDALQSYDRATAINPNLIYAKYERGATLLALGRFKEGWHIYEQRRQTDDFGRAPPVIEARIQTVGSREELAGKIVAVLAEQGVGDEIMFASMLPDLLRDAKAVTYEIDPRLVRLFSPNFPSVNFVARKSQEQLLRGEVAQEFLNGQFDVTIYAGTLGRVYRPELKAFPRSPYLKPQAESVNRWRASLADGSGLLRVGITWRGGSKKTGHSDRSMTLDQMKPLLDRADCQFVSLQYGDVADEIDSFNRTSGGRIKYFPKEQINDFEELGALIEALDLVISVQNTTVHLCGAMGKTCFAMLPRRAEWRYGASGREMAWYSSVELWRQTETANWAEVLEAINRRLDTEVQRARSN